MIWSVMDVLEQGYVLAQQLGLVRSKAEFSEKLLEKGSSYLSSMSARDRCPSRDVVLTLENKLLALLVAHNGTTHYGMNPAPITTQFYARLQRVYEFIKAARLVLEAFADGFHPTNDNDGPPQQTEAQIIALSYCQPNLILAPEQPKQLEAQG